MGEPPTPPFPHYTVVLHVTLFIGIDGRQLKANRGWFTSGQWAPPPHPPSILNKRETFQQDIERLNKQQYMQVHDVYLYICALQFLELNTS